MFTKEDRDKVRYELLEVARNDARISGAALTGSASVGKEDEWSDIDLAFGIRDVSNLESALSDFSARMYDKYGALHHLDVPSGTWIYRVFFLANTLQVDLAFAPEEDFGAKGPTFKLIFGVAKGGTHPTHPPANQLIGMAWLYALHARSCIARNKPWQAEFMISSMRDQILSLACLRHHLPAQQGRGLDDLPSDVTEPLKASLVKSLEQDELRRAFKETTTALLSEIQSVDPRLAGRLQPALTELTR